MSATRLEFIKPYADQLLHTTKALNEGLYTEFTAGKAAQMAQGKVDDRVLALKLTATLDGKNADSRALQLEEVLRADSEYNMLRADLIVATTESERVSMIVRQLVNQWRALKAIVSSMSGGD